jgi:hypothetical protein
VSFIINKKYRWLVYGKKKDLDHRVRCIKLSIEKLRECHCTCLKERGTRLTRVKWRARADSTFYTARTCKIILERESALNWHAASVELERSSKQEKERKKQLVEARRGEEATTNRKAIHSL